MTGTAGKSARGSDGPWPPSNFCDIGTFLSDPAAQVPHTYKSKTKNPLTGRRTSRRYRQRGAHERRRDPLLSARGLPTKPQGPTPQPSSPGQPLPASHAPREFYCMLARRARLLCSPPSASAHTDLPAGPPFFLILDIDRGRWLADRAGWVTIPAGRIARVLHPTTT